MLTTTLRLAIASLVVLLLLNIVTSAQAPTRIKFRRGSARADVSGTLNGFKSKRVYVIRVRDAQVLKTEQIGSGSRRITIMIKEPNGNYVEDSDASCNDHHEVLPTTAGDYRIEVTECRKADPWRGRFTFRVTVR